MPTTYSEAIVICNNCKRKGIRTCAVKGETYFVGKDVADALGYTNPQKAIRDHIDAEDKLGERIVQSGQPMEASRLYLTNDNYKKSENYKSIIK